MTEIKHGSNSAYSNQGCRCDPCKEAHRVASRAHRQARKDKGLTARGTVRLTTPYKPSKIVPHTHACGCVDCRAAIAEYARERNLLLRYGLTIAEYDTMRRSQDGKCAACGDNLLPGRSASVDHDHDTGRVRGLLCSNCNRALGLLNDNPARVQGLLNYITQPV